MWFSGGLGHAELIVRLNNFWGLLQFRWFHDSTIPCCLSIIPFHWTPPVSQSQKEVIILILYI